MADAEDHNFLRQRDARKYRSGDVPRIHVAGVRHQACFCREEFCFGIRFRVLANVRRQFRGIGGIKTSSDGRMAKHISARKLREAGKAYPLF